MDGGKTFLTAGLVVIVGFGGALAFRNVPDESQTGEQGDVAIVRRAETGDELAQTPMERDSSRIHASAQLSGRIDAFQFGGVPAQPQERLTAEYDPATTIAARDANEFGAAPEASVPRMPSSFYSTPEPPAVESSLPVDAGRLAPDDLMPLRPGVRATGVAASRAAETAPAAPASAPTSAGGFQKPRRHMVRDGDTLVGLAERYYGDANRFSDIFAANRDVLSNPDVLPIGVRLNVPVDLPAAGGATGSSAATQPAARLVPQVQFRGLDGR